MKPGLERAIHITTMESQETKEIHKKSNIMNDNSIVDYDSLDLRQEPISSLPFFPAAPPFIEQPSSKRSSIFPKIIHIFPEYTSADISLRKTLSQRANSGSFTYSTSTSDMKSRIESLRANRKMNEENESKERRFKISNTSKPYLRVGKRYFVGSSTTSQTSASLDQSSTTSTSYVLPNQASSSSSSKKNQTSSFGRRSFFSLVPKTQPQVQSPMHISSLMSPSPPSSPYHPEYRNSGQKTIRRD